MRYVSVISGYLLSTGFCGLTSCQRDHRDLGRHSLVSELRYTNTKDSVGHRYSLCILIN